MDDIKQMVLDIWAWLQANVLVPEVLGQLALIIVYAFVSHFLAKILNNRLTEFAAKNKNMAKVEDFVEPLYFPAVLLILLFITQTLGTTFELPVTVIRGATVLTIAWIGVRLITRFIRSQFLARVLSVSVVSIAGLQIAGVLGPIVVVLKGFSIPLGESRVSAFDVLSGVLTLVVFVWLGLVLSRFIDAQLKASRNINPSLKVLLGKISKIGLISLAFLISLNIIGIDLTALAVFSGALGVGLGFGLQKVVSNFISGVILLMDRSIKPGDVIQIQDTYGAINKLAARYTSVITRDGTEFLIPNEDMITQPVINWSHTNKIVRRRIPVQVAYSTNLNDAMDIMNQSAASNPRVLPEPAPKTLIKAFADNGVELELRMWINDPEEGVSNIGSEVMMEIWDRFHEAGIEFPFPQRVIHYAKDPRPAKKTARKKK